MTDFETIRYESNDGVAAITLARPDKRNAMNSRMFAELGDAAERAASDHAVRAVLIRGEDRSFCAGIDVTSFAELAAADGGPASFIRTAQRPFRIIGTMPRPVVAAVQGHALGAGLQLALACDLRVLAEDTLLGMLEIRFGIIPDLGGNHRLARLVGPARAKELVWTGRRVDASEADRLGLANRIVAVDALQKEAEELARALAAGPPVPISLAKGLIDRAGETSFEALMDREAELQARCLSSEDHREAVAAFFEKRPTTFTGR